ncbi:citrate transporter [Enterococcus sp. LJL120]
MDLLIGIILILSFFGLVLYSVKGFNLMVGFFLMASLWTILPIIGHLSVGVSWSEIGTMLQAVYQNAPETWGAVLVNVFFGAFFGRVLLDTGIAATIIRKSVELGGDNSGLILVIVNVITGIIFTSLAGAGPVISIAIVVLPILFSIGIPKSVALFSFTGSVAAGIFINPINFTQYHAFFETGSSYTYNQYFNFGIIGFIVMLAVVSSFALFFLKRANPVFNWDSADIEEDESDVKNAPNIALLTPFLPVIGVIFLKLPVILCFILASIFALVVCRELTEGFRAASRTFTKLYSDAVKDTSALVGFWMALSMFNAASSFAGPYFQTMIGGTIPTSALALCVLFIVLSPLTWFRGPMNLVGSGAAILAVIMQVNPDLPITFLYPLFLSILVGMGHFDITTSWISWGLGYAKVESRDYMKMALLPGMLICLILEMLTFIWFGN